MVTLNGQVLSVTKFPNNETPFLEIQSDNDFIIIMDYQSDEDIFRVQMCKKYLDDTYWNPKVTLRMRYVPYSRMDRKIEGFILSSKYFSQLINDLHFASVEVMDAHSSVSTALLNHCVEMDIRRHLFDIYFHLQKQLDFVFYPDDGACKRYSEKLKLPESIPFFFGKKRRNLLTGEILDYELVDCPDIKDKSILIFDDLCAKGFTFYNAALKLRQAGASKIYLYVTHCENSIYEGVMLNSGLIDRIYTTDSLLKNWTSKIIYNIGDIDGFLSQ